MSLAVIKDLKQKIKDARDEMRRTGRKALEGAFAEFFTTVPEIEAILWTQYTPYFNDGDTCEFYVNELVVQLTPEAYKNYTGKDLDPDDISFFEGHEYAKGYYGSKEPRVKEIQALKNQFVKDVIDHDLFLATFGDHAQVKATRTGLEVEECDHD